MRNFWRKLGDNLFSCYSFFCGFIVLGILGLGTILVFQKGISALSVSFLISPMKGSGISGGIVYQIIGTCITLASTFVIVLPFSLATALFRSFYIKSVSLKKAFTVFLYTLNGVPSIIFGLVGFVFFVKYLELGKSWLTGGLLLAIMILPTTALALSEGINRIPKEYIENASSLGLKPSAIIFSVLLPQSFASLISGILIGIARAIGETAPVMFTATVFAGATIPHGVKESPILSLPYHIFNLAQESYHEQALQNAWGSACVLIMIVFVLSFCSLPFRLTVHQEAKVS